MPLGVPLLTSGHRQEAVRPVRSTVGHVTQLRIAWTVAVESSWTGQIVSPVAQVGSGRTRKRILAKHVKPHVKNARTLPPSAPAVQWASSYQAPPAMTARYRTAMTVPTPTNATRMAVLNATSEPMTICARHVAHSARHVLQRINARNVITITS